MNKNVCKIGALIKAKHLSELIVNSCYKIRILDGSFFLQKARQNAYENYIKEHIPGAQFFDIDKCVTPSRYKRMLPSVQVFENYVGDLGIDNNTHVVVYDNHPDYALYSAARVWWMFRVFGHNSVSLLENGLRAWKDMNFQLTHGTEKTESKCFHASFTSSLVNTFEQVRDNIEGQKFQLIDARSTGRFDGTALNADPDTLPGHIRGSINLPYRDIQEECSDKHGGIVKHGAMKSVQDLREVFRSHDIDLERPIATTCGSGVTACNIAFAAFLCGKTDVSVYDGSWIEWYNRSTPDMRENCPEEKVH